MTYALRRLQSVGRSSLENDGWPVLKAVETPWVAYALRRLQSVGCSSLENGGCRILNASETSWVAYALRRLQSVGRSSLGNATNLRLMKTISMDRFSEALLLDSSCTNCSRANRRDARRASL